MIVITCSVCDRRMLLPLSMVNGMERRMDVTGQVVYELTYTCWCGVAGAKFVKGPRSP